MSNPAPHIYLIPGLGADHRVFKNLDFKGLSHTTIEWIVPLEKETLVDYSHRLLKQVKHPKPILIGMSLGGMIAIEFSKLIGTSQVVIISSLKSRKEMPFYFKVAAWCGLQKLFTKRRLVSSMGIFYWLFGLSTSSEKSLLNKIIADTDEHFLLWAMNALLHWEGKASPVPIFHIHGDIDRIIPVHFVTANAIIKDGSHFMIINKAPEISQLLRQFFLRR